LLELEDEDVLEGEALLEVPALDDDDDRSLVLVVLEAVVVLAVFGEQFTKTNSDNDINDNEIIFRMVIFFAKIKIIM
jgi:hypothetical protein